MTSRSGGPTAGRRWPTASVPAGAPAQATLEVTITADPAGRLAERAGQRPVLAARPRLRWRPCRRDRNYGVLPALHPPLADGQPVEYTVHYRNRGRARGRGRAPRAEHARPGAAARRRRSTWATSRPAARGKRPSGRWRTGAPGRCRWRRQGAGLRCRARARAGPALEWIWVAHRVDRGAPENGRVELRTAHRAAYPAPERPGRRRVGRARGDGRSAGPERRPDRSPVRWPGRSRGAGRATGTPDGALPDGSRSRCACGRPTSSASTSAWSEPQTVVVDAGAARGRLQCGEPAAVRPGAIVGGRSADALRHGGDASGVAAVSVCVQDLPAQGERDVRRGASCRRAGRLDVPHARPGGARLRQPHRHDLGRGRAWATARRSRWSLSGARRQRGAGADGQPGRERGGAGPHDDRAQRDGRGWIRGGRRPGGGCLGAGAAAGGRGLPGGHGAGRRHVALRPDGGAIRASTRCGSTPTMRPATAPAPARSRSQVTCADATVAAVALTAEPSPAGGQWLTLRPTIRNTGPDAHAGRPAVRALWAR